MTTKQDIQSTNTFEKKVLTNWYKSVIIYLRTEEIAIDRQKTSSKFLKKTLDKPKNICYNSLVRKSSTNLQKIVH